MCHRGPGSRPGAPWVAAGTQTMMPEPLRELRASAPHREELRLRLEHMSRSAHAQDQARPLAQSTGFADFDALLPGGGWPVGAITELMPETYGIGELSLLLPALAKL